MFLLLFWLLGLLNTSPQEHAHLPHPSFPYKSPSDIIFLLENLLPISVCLNFPPEKKTVQLTLYRQPMFLRSSYSSQKVRYESVPNTVSYCQTRSKVLTQLEDRGYKREKELHGADGACRVRASAELAGAGEPPVYPQWLGYRSSVAFSQCREAGHWYLNEKSFNGDPLNNFKTKCRKMNTFTK